MKTENIRAEVDLSVGANNDVSRKGKIPPAHGAGEEPSSKQPVFTTQDLQILICGKKFLLDCGHTARPGHGLSNTLIIYSEGGGIIKTACHNCGY
jgi:hypothetical protein